MSSEFRFVYLTSLYDETVALLRDVLEFPVTDSWDRAGDHRGTVFAAASGLIEVLENVALQRGPSHTASGEPFLAIEVEDIDALQAKYAGESQLPEGSTTSTKAVTWPVSVSDKSPLVPPSLSAT